MRKSLQCPSTSSKSTEITMVKSSTKTCWPDIRKTGTEWQLLIEPEPRSITCKDKLRDTTATKPHGKAAYQHWDMPLRRPNHRRGRYSLDQRSFHSQSDIFS
ncbi:hypothetical protein Rs2_16228 [Raphanus sativus]|nr:hypothetical protein Rs2_16228 [Raphanus sativus]